MNTLKLISSYVLDRLQEKSTWQAIVAILTAVGVQINPDQATLIISTGVSTVAAIVAISKG